MTLRPVAADELARGLVEGGVAPLAAVGWASYGRGGWRTGVGGATTAIFDLASVTKPVTALAVARTPGLRQRRLGELVAEAADTASADVPLELLLAHRAGLEAHLPLFAPLVAGRPVDRGAALRAAAEARRPGLDGPPPVDGFPPVYSDLGYLLTGEALRRHDAAADVGDVLEARVLDPVGVTEELGTAQALRARLGEAAFRERVVPTEVVPFRGGEVRGVVHDENAWAVNGEGGSGHAGLFGTAAATLAFGCAVHDAIERGEGPLASGEDLGWLVAERPGGTLRAGFDAKSAEGSSAGARAGPRTFGHLGFTGTSLWIDPDARAVVVVLTNRVHPTRENVAIRAARPHVHDALFALARDAC